MGIDDTYKGIKFPAPLKPGDRIALLSPASAVKEEYVFGAMSKLIDRGYEPVLMPHALGHVSGSYAASKAERLMDLFESLEDPEIKAILCTRGGYGCCQLLANLPCGMIASNSKWIIGFSDVSALLAAWCNRNVASIHGPMAKHIATMPADDKCTDALFNILESGGKFDYTVTPHEYNQEGKAEGVLRGGNMAVLTDLADTPDDILDIDRSGEGTILFFEDINEPIYKVNRMLWRLHLNGTLSRVNGIIFGQFTDYKPDANFATMEEMLRDFFKRNFPVPQYPIVYNFPVGHTDLNLPLVVGSKVQLEVTPSLVNLHTI